VDILVNNAGEYVHRSWMDASWEDWLDTYRINVAASVRLVQRLVPPMRERGWGRVIQIGGAMAIQPTEAYPHYGASLAARHHLAVSLARELKGTGVTSNVVAPGAIRVPMLEQILAKAAESFDWGDTWEEIERVARAHPEKRIKTLRQPGRGKGDAVRAGFAVAEGDLFMILDADLTVPPEEMPKFYDAIVSGRAEFANGSRLVYPMEKAAMRFMNMCANKAFGILFTWILGQSLKDTLCGTKVLRRADYERIAANRAYFGDFDPFGDFDLLFGAARLNLKIVDVPVRYRDRTYGSTNIQRWRHGWLLLRMVMFAARKLKFV